MGETLLVAHEGALLVLTRNSLRDSFQPVDLSAAAQLEKGDWGIVLRLTAHDGEHTLEVRSSDLPRVKALLAETQDRSPSRPVDDRRRTRERENPRWPLATTRMTDELWSRYLLHPEEDRSIGAILATLSPFIAPMTARPPRQFGLKRKERRDLATDQLLFSRVFNYATSVLNVIQPELYVRPNVRIALMMAHTRSVPSFVVGADLLQGRPEKELAFAVAKQLSYLRPERFLRRVLLVPSQLRTVFFVALRIANPQLTVPPADRPEVERTLKHVADRMHAGILGHLAVLVRSLAASRSEVDLDTWWSVTALTANRAGLLVCGDLQVAEMMLRAEPIELGAPPRDAQLQDLAHFSSSEEYSELQRQLGLTGC